MKHSIISVDVEDYFHVEAFSGVIRPAAWSGYESRVERNTARLLDLLDDCHVTATFFILGWVAERHPRLVRSIAERGHEPACHSYWHRLVYKLTPAEFREDTLLAKTRDRTSRGRPDSRLSRAQFFHRPPVSVGAGCACRAWISIRLERVSRKT